MSSRAGRRVAVSTLSVIKAATPFATIALFGNLIVSLSDKRFEDSQKAADQRFEDSKKAAAQRFEDSQKAADQRHAAAEKAADQRHAAADQRFADMIALAKNNRDKDNELVELKIKLSEAKKKKSWME
jgi:hypothetical protein